MNPHWPTAIFNKTGAERVARATLNPALAARTWEALADGQVEHQGERVIYGALLFRFCASLRIAQLLPKTGASRVEEALDILIAAEGRAEPGGIVAATALILDLRAPQASAIFVNFPSFANAVGQGGAGLMVAPLTDLLAALGDERNWAALVRGAVDEDDELDEYLVTAPAVRSATVPAGVA